MMKLTDYIEQSLSNLSKKKLRTFLTTSGVVIGIGALVCMFAFGQGVQYTITERFEKMDLLNYVTIYKGERPRVGRRGRDRDPDEAGNRDAGQEGGEGGPVLDDNLIRELSELEGVEAVFSEVRFPAKIRIGGKEQLELIQILSEEICRSGPITLRAGRFYEGEEKGLIISDRLLRRMGIRDPEAVIGQEVEVSTLTFNLGRLLMMGVPYLGSDQAGPMTTQPYTFEIVGVAERSEFGGPMMVGSEVFIGSGPAATMRKIVLTSIWDFFQDSSKKQGYSSLNIKLKSIRELEPVRIELKKRNLRSFALIDRLEEIQKGFLFMDMFLLAVGMIAIVVATLGIVNTMVMSILERYKEIGIMKAVGASEGDVKRIFFFESGTIGFMGGVFGLGLGWLVGEAINQVVNIYLSRQGVGFVDYFRFPWWLCLGAVVFAVSISLMAGIYPARRAARVDPIVALRHD